MGFCFVLNFFYPAFFKAVLENADIFAAGRYAVHVPGRKICAVVEMNFGDFGVDRINPEHATRDSFYLFLEADVSNFTLGHHFPSAQPLKIDPKSKYCQYDD